MKPAVFFDRDGVLNVEKHFVYKREDFEWMPGAAEAVGLLNRLGYHVFVVTNQSGVARGFYRMEDVAALHGFMNGELAGCGAKIDSFYVCPHHPAFGPPCLCRKPRPGLLLAAIDEYAVDKERSFLIGDKDTDIEAAAGAGIKGYLFQAGNLCERVKTILRKQNREKT
ncbi:MAG: HAD family hydrolase [Acidaminococcales bacterium]|jgi:D-glycero-D-manno-heptose 1,7-bisphosphate phosphatase|nr:HAD family hydrolase [Acidaminococcales bacterium]